MLKKKAVIINHEPKQILICPKKTTTYSIFP